MELRRDDVNNIKFVCLMERGLSATRTDAIRSGTDLMLELQKTGLISASKVEFLEEVLPIVKRRDLLDAVRQYKLDRKLSDDSHVGMSTQETRKHKKKEFADGETTPKDDSCSTGSNLSDEEKLSVGQQDTLADRSRRAMPRQKHTLDEVAFWLAKGLEQSGRCRSEVDVKHSAKLSVSKTWMPIRNDWFSSTR